MTQRASSMPRRSSNDAITAILHESESAMGYHSRREDLDVVAEPRRRGPQPERSAILRAVCAATSTWGGRSSVRAGIGPRLARRLALPECLSGARVKYMSRIRPAASCSTLTRSRRPSWRMRIGGGEVGVKPGFWFLQKERRREKKPETSAAPNASASHECVRGLQRI